MSILYEVIELTTGQPESHAVIKVDTEKRTESGGLEAVTVALCFPEEDAARTADDFRTRHPKGDA